MFVVVVLRILFSDARCIPGRTYPLHSIVTTHQHSLMTRTWIVRAGAQSVVSPHGQLRPWSPQACHALGDLRTCALVCEDTLPFPQL